MFGRVKRDVVGIGSLYLCPAVIPIPLVVSQVNEEDGRLGVNGLWIGDATSP